MFSLFFPLFSSLFLSFFFPSLLSQIGLQRDMKLQLTHFFSSLFPLLCFHPFFCFPALFFPLSFHSEYLHQTSLGKKKMREREVVGKKESDRKREKIELGSRFFSLFSPPTPSCHSLLPLFPPKFIR